MNYNYGQCPICGEFDWKDTHVCVPVYGVWNEDDDIEDAKDVRAPNPEDAAEKFVSDRYRYADFECPEETIVFVTDYGGHTWKFEVLSEQTITHNAVELKPCPDGGHCQNEDVVEELRAENERLRAILAWYADEENYREEYYEDERCEDSMVRVDRGERARKALKGGE